MAKFPTIEEMAQNVAEKALDEIEYNGKTIRQWIEIISASEHSTNLASLGTDCISRQAAIDAARDWYEGLICGSFKGLEKRLRSLPPAQPDIIRCRNCKFASGDSRICMKFGHSPIGELDFCAWAERRTDE